jgi:hypothetical protein
MYLEKGNEKINKYPFPGTSQLRFYYGFGQSAPAVQIAIQQAQNEGIADAFEFQLG